MFSFLGWLIKKGRKRAGVSESINGETGSSPNFCIHFFFIALVVRNFFFSCANSFSEYFRTRKPYLCALYNDLVLLSLTSLLLHTQQLFLQVFTIKIPYISRVRGGEKKNIRLLRIEKLRCKMFSNGFRPGWKSMLAMDVADMHDFADSFHCYCLNPEKRMWWKTTIYRFQTENPEMYAWHKNL